MTEPKEYDMTNFEDIERWFKEMGGYLKVSKFLTDGTDKAGRAYAYQGFIQLKQNFLAALPFMKLSKEKIEKK